MLGPLVVCGVVLSGVGVVVILESPESEEDSLLSVSLFSESGMSLLSEFDCSELSELVSVVSTSEDSESELEVSVLVVSSGVGVICSVVSSEVVVVVSLGVVVIS